MLCLDKVRASHPTHGKLGGGISDGEYASRILTSTVPARLTRCSIKSRIDDSVYNDLKIQTLEPQKTQL